MIICTTLTSKLLAESFSLIPPTRRQQLVVQSYSTSAEIQKYAWHLLLETSCMCTVHINIHSFGVVVDEDNCVVITWLFWPHCNLFNKLITTAGITQWAINGKKTKFHQIEQLTCIAVTCLNWIMYFMAVCILASRAALLPFWKFKYVSRELSYSLITDKFPLCVSVFY